MKCWLALCLTAVACGQGDTVTGSHARCAEGGAINDCPDAEPTPEGACWRLVDCGVIPISSGGQDNHFDWGDCVDQIERSSSASQALVISCISASTCDGLKSEHSPDDPQDLLCFHLGGR